MNDSAMGCAAQARTMRAQAQTQTVSFKDTVVQRLNASQSESYTHTQTHRHDWRE